MQRRFIAILLVAVVALAAAVGTHIQPAQAYADVSSYEATCSYLHAQGTSSSPYVWLYAYSYDSGDEFYVVMPVNSDGTFDYTLAFSTQPTGSEMNFEVWGALTSNPDFSDPDYWDYEGYFDVTVYCDDAVPGPSAPAGFTLHTITCDTALYSTPGGVMVAGTTITAGQTWFVSPTPTPASDGSSWTEIFVGGPLDAFIPTSCVQ